MELIGENSQSIPAQIIGFFSLHKVDEHEALAGTAISNIMIIERVVLHTENVDSGSKAVAMLQRKQLIMPFLVLLWLAACSVGLFGLAIYKNTPGAADGGPERWPELGLRRGADFTLVVSVHPQCPCTSATLEELAIILTRCPRLKTYLLFVKPAGMSESWVKSALWQTASKFPNCTLVVDSAGKLSAAFKASSSGQSYLYDPNGHLLYSGGLTVSRGHSGDNQGVSTVISLVNRETKIGKSYPVFGCPLFVDNTGAGKRAED